MRGLLPDVRMPGQRRLVQMPERVRPARFRPHGDQVLQAVVLLAVEMPDLHQLLRVGIPGEFRAVGDHLRREEGTDARQRLESGGIGGVEVDFRNVDEGFEPPEDAVVHDIGPREIGFPAEPAAFLPVVVDGLGLFLAESQPHQVVDAHGVGVEAERLVAARRHAPADGFRRGSVGGVPPEDGGLRRSGARAACGIRSGGRQRRDIDGVRSIVVRDDAHHARPLDEQRGLIADDQE